MTLSSSNLNEIANLYENIAASEQEQLNEDIIKQGLTRQAMANAFKKSGGFNSPEFKKLGNSGGLENSIKQGLTRQAMANAYNKKPAATPAAATPARTPAAATPARTPAAATPARTATANPKVAPTKPAAKPPAATTPKVVPTKPAGSPMQQWAAAHSDLAAKVKSGQSGYNDIQKQRTSTALNAPAAPASSTLGKAVSVASKPQTAFKPATTAVASSTTDKGVVPASDKLAATTKSVPLKASYEYDAYDLVLEYLFDNGHVDTVEEAHYVMMELDAETISEIAHGTGKRVMPSAKKRSALAKKARAGEDIGKPGKGFEKVAAKAAKQYGSKEAGERVAAAAMFKAQAKKG